MLAAWLLPANVSVLRAALYGFLGGLLGLILLLVFTYMYFLIRAPYIQRNEARNRVRELEKAQGDSDIIIELEATNLLLNGVKVSFARLLWGLSDFLCDGLGVTVLPQLLSSRFGEKDPIIWASVQRELITKLCAKKLIDSFQKQTTIRGTETHYKFTELGYEQLDQLKTKGWPNP